MKTKDKKKFNKFIIFSLIAFTFLVISACVVLCLTIPSNVMRTYEIITATFTAYSSLSLILLVIQLILSKQDSSDRHDEKRREKTVDYMIKWSESLLSWETAYAVKIVETFTHEQCEHLYNYKPFEVDYKTKKDLCNICRHHLKDTCRRCTECDENTNPSCDCDKNSQKEKVYTIDEVQGAEIRWYIIKYLNQLESLLLSWKQGIVDRDIIEEQFDHLYKPGTGKDTLQYFRNIAGGGKAYPTIEEFCLNLRNKRQETTNKMKELL